MTNAPSGSNHPHPTRNASVPAPPLSPVVSRSKKTNGGRRRRAAREERRIVRRLLETFRRMRQSPRGHGAPTAPTRRSTTKQPARHSPPKARSRTGSARGSQVGRVGRVGQRRVGWVGRVERVRGWVAGRCRRAAGLTPGAPGVLTIARMRSASVLKTVAPPRELRHASDAASASSRSRMRSAAVLASGPVFPIGPDASRAAVLARALGDQRARARQQLVVHPVERLAEADAARIVVVDEDLLRAGDAAGAEVSVAGVDRDADVVAVAHQQQLRDLLHRERQTDDAVAPIVGRVRQHAPSPPPESSASTTSCASAVRADPARPIRRSRWCRT